LKFDFFSNSISFQICFLFNLILVKKIVYLNMTLLPVDLFVLPESRRLAVDLAAVVANVTFALIKKLSKNVD
jgi:hypothetical protein